MRWKTLWGVTLLAGALALLGTPDLSRAQRVAGNEAPKVGSESGSEESRSQYLDRIEKEIRELGKRIDELGKQAEAAGGKAKIEARKAVKELAAEKRRLEAEAKELKRSGEKAWRKLRSRMDSALEELKGSVEKFRAKFAPGKGEAT